MHSNQTRNGMAIIILAVGITLLSGIGLSDGAVRVDRGHIPMSGADQVEAKWTLIDPEGVALRDGEERDWINRSRSTTFDHAGFRDHVLNQPDHPIIAVPLFDDVSFIARTRRVKQSSDDRFTWIGDLEGVSGGHIIVSVRGEAAHGMINAPGYGLFEFHPAPVNPDEERAGGRRDAARYVIHEIDADQLPGCGVGPEQCVGDPRRHPLGGIGNRWRQSGGVRDLPGRGDAAGERRGGKTASGETLILRVMVAYTPAASNAVGGQQAMLAFIDSTIAQTNLAFENSMIDLHAELAHAHLVNYTGSGSITTDLYRITDDGDGFMDEVHELRAFHQADLVALLVTYSGGACGVAWCMTTPSVDFAPLGFSVTRIQCVSNLTFPHELGHNMGCHHDHQNSGGNCGTFPYSFGHRFFGNSGGQWRTVLAYTPGQRITHFSNPNVLLDGQPTGVPVGLSGQAHNAQTINLNAPIVTSFADQFEPPIPPGNNTCENRITISDGSTAFSTEYATTDGPDEPANCTFFGHPGISNDVWFEYTATCTGEVTIGLCNSAFPTKLGVYEGAACPTEPDTVAACDVTSCRESTQSEVTMSVQEGEILLIRVGGRIHQTGNGMIDIVCEIPEPAIPGDLNGDGLVNGVDLLIMLGSWGGCPDCGDCPADLNDDCSVDGLDLLVLLENWG